MKTKNEILADVIQAGLKVLICGYAAGNASAKLHCYYASPTNLFWPTLHATGLTPRLLACSEFKMLPEFGIGLTDLAKHSYGPNDRIPVEDIDVPSFVAKVAKYSPRIVAFNGYRTAEWVLKPPIRYGKCKDGLHGAECFVLHSTSSRQEDSWSDKHWFELAERVKQLGVA